MVILSQDYSWISWLLPFLLQGLSLWHLFLAKIVCHLSCREEERAGMTRELRLQIHVPCKAEDWQLCCQCAWKTTAPCGLRKRTWHQHFSVREALPHYIGTGTWGSCGKEDVNVATKFKGNIVLVLKRERLFLDCDPYCLCWGLQEVFKVLDVIFKVVDTVKLPKECIKAAWVSALLQFCNINCKNADNYIKRDSIKALGKNQAWKKGMLHLKQSQKIHLQSNSELC